MVQARRSSPDPRETDPTLGSTAVRRKTRVGGHKGDFHPLEHVTSLGRRSSGPHAMTITVATVVWPGCVGESEFVPGLVRQHVAF